MARRPGIDAVWGGCVGGGGGVRVPRPQPICKCCTIIVCTPDAPFRGVRFNSLSTSVGNDGFNKERSTAVCIESFLCKDSWTFMVCIESFLCDSWTFISVLSLFCVIHGSLRSVLSLFCVIHGPLWSVLSLFCVIHGPLRSVFSLFCVIHGALWFVPFVHLGLNLMLLIVSERATANG